jgi:hypothetical protein
MTENNVNEPIIQQRRRSRSFFWPILLISAGILFLLSNLGIVGWSTWNTLWRFWPLILIAVGIDVLFGNRSALGAVISIILILALIGAVAGAVIFADQLPIISRYTQDTPWKTDHVEQALEDYGSASVYIDWTSLPGYLGALEDSNNLLEGDLTYQGDLVFEVDSRGSRAEVSLDTRQVNIWGFNIGGPGPRSSWEIYLTPEIPLELNLNSGSGSCDFDLSDLILEDFYLDSGSGSVSLALPEGQSYPVKIDSGSGSLRLDIPEDTGMRVRLDSGSGSFNPGADFILVSGERRGDGVWESHNYGSAKYAIEMTIDQGSGSISFR